MTRLILLRHGQSQWNLENRFTGWVDVDLTAEGEGQARRGGELIAGAAVQVAFNFGNAIGSIVGGAMLTTFSMNYRYTGLGGMPLALLAVGLLAFYSWRCETDTDAIHRLRETKVD